MAWNEHRVIAHGPQALRDAGNQGVVVALRKVCAANAPSKQHIANKRTLNLGGVKHHMAWRMARAVSNVQSVGAQSDGIAIGQPPGWRENFCVGKLKHATLIRQTINPKLITRVRPHNGQIQFARQNCRAACVINVRVREPNLLQFQVPLLDL